MLRNYFRRVLLLLLILGVICTSFAKLDNRVPIRIVDEPASYNFGNDLIQPNTRRISPRLEAKVQPSNVSIPEHLIPLKGTCFNLTSGKYRYEFCPFQNVTQYELNYVWNPYQSILGIWKDWEIINGTFTSMIMLEGDACGTIYRKAKIIMECGNMNNLSSVHEYEKCKYVFHFVTPLVCNPDSMLVYPLLSTELRNKWDILWTKFRMEELTEKGYNKKLDEIFVKAGLRLPAKSVPTPEVKSTMSTRSDLLTFRSLQECTMEYERLQKEIESLRVILALNDLSDGDI